MSRAKETSDNVPNNIMSLIAGRKKSFFEMLVKKTGVRFSLERNNRNKSDNCQLTGSVESVALARKILETAASRSSTKHSAITLDILRQAANDEILANKIAKKMGDNERKRVCNTSSAANLLNKRSPTTDTGTNKHESSQKCEGTVTVSGKVGFGSVDNTQASVYEQVNEVSFSTGVHKNTNIEDTQELPLKIELQHNDIMTLHSDFIAGNTDYTSRSKMPESLVVECVVPSSGNSPMTSCNIGVPEKKKCDGSVDRSTDTVHDIMEEIKISIRTESEATNDDISLNEQGGKKSDKAHTVGQIHSGSKVLLAFKEADIATASRDQCCVLKNFTNSKTLDQNSADAIKKLFVYVPYNEDVMGNKKLFNIFKFDSELDAYKKIRNILECHGLDSQIDLGSVSLHDDASQPISWGKDSTQLGGSPADMQHPGREPSDTDLGKLLQLSTEAIVQASAEGSTPLQAEECLSEMEGCPNKNNTQNLVLDGSGTQSQDGATASGVDASNSKHSDTLVTVNPEFEELKNMSSMHVMQTIVDKSEIKGDDGKVSYACPWCPFKTGVKLQLKHHLKRMHHERKYKCLYCERRYGLRKDLQKHLRYHRERHACGVCGKRYRDIGQIKKHLRSHCSNYEADKYPCSQCGKLFSAKFSLKTHIVRVHESGSRNFSCRVCQKKFVYKAHLKDHYNVHSGIRPFVCGVCGKAFHLKTSLKHHSDIHNPIRKFVCDVCHKAFKQRNSLRMHKQIHLGPCFECNICFRKFTQKHSMLRHRRMHSGDRPFTCGVCLIHFSDQSVLRRHLMGVHNVEKVELRKVLSIHRAAQRNEKGVGEVKKIQVQDVQKSDGVLSQENASNPGINSEASGSVLAVPCTDKDSNAMELDKGILDNDNSGQMNVICPSEGVDTNVVSPEDRKSELKAMPCTSNPTESNFSHTINNQSVTGNDALRMISQLASSAKILPVQPIMGSPELCNVVQLSSDSQNSTSLDHAEEARPTAEISSKPILLQPIKKNMFEEDFDVLMSEYEGVEITTSSGMKVFECKLCKMRYTNKVAMVRHAQRVHKSFARNALVRMDGVCPKAVPTVNITAASTHAKEISPVTVLPGSRIKKPRSSSTVTRRTHFSPAPQRIIDPVNKVQFIFQEPAQHTQNLYQLLPNLLTNDNITSAISLPVNQHLAASATTSAAFQNFKPGQLQMVAMDDSPSSALQPDPAQTSILGTEEIVLNVLPPGQLLDRDDTKTIYVMDKGGCITFPGSSGRADTSSVQLQFTGNPDDTSIDATSLDSITGPNSGLEIQQLPSLTQEQIDQLVASQTMLPNNMLDMNSLTYQNIQFVSEPTDNIGCNVNPIVSENVEEGQGQDAIMVDNVALADAIDQANIGDTIQVYVTTAAEELRQQIMEEES